MRRAKTVYLLIRAPEARDVAINRHFTDRRQKMEIKFKSGIV